MCVFVRVYPPSVRASRLSSQNVTYDIIILPHYVYVFLDRWTLFIVTSSLHLILVPTSLYIVYVRFFIVPSTRILVAVLVTPFIRVVQGLHRHVASMLLLLVPVCMARPCVFIERVECFTAIDQICAVGLCNIRRLCSLACSSLKRRWARTYVRVALYGLIRLQVSIADDKVNSP